MPYATQQDLVDRFGDAELLRIADRDGDDQIDSPVVDQALTDADDEINAYLSTRYTVPMDPAPALLNRLCADIARYRLYDEAPLEEVENRYKSAVSLLRDISNGKASLATSNAEPVTSGDVEATRGDADRVFTRETLAGY